MNYPDNDIECPDCLLSKEECNCEYHIEMMKEYSWMGNVVKNYPELFDPKNIGKTKQQLINQ